MHQFQDQNFSLDFLANVQRTLVSISFFLARLYLFIFLVFVRYVVFI